MSRFVSVNVSSVRWYCRDSAIDWCNLRFSISHGRISAGYREAQCGWVASWEDVDATAARADEESATARTASFLVIYIAKRGLLEVWTAQQGTRVAAFNCSKNAKFVPLKISRVLSYLVLLQFRSRRRLLYVGITSCDRDLPQFRLLSPDGKVDVVVPIHCALK